MQLSAIPIGLLIRVLISDESVRSIIGISWTIFSFLAALVVILLLLKPERSLRKHPDAASPWMVVIWSIIGIFMALFGQSIVNIFQMLVLGIEPGSENTQNIMQIARSAPAFIIVVAIIGPILEEIVFRKIIFGEIYKRTNFLVGGLVSGLIFAAVHNDFQNTLVYLTIAFVFAFVYVQSKRIIVPILAHATMNAIVVVVQLGVDPDELNQIMEQYDKLQMILIGG